MYKAYAHTTDDGNKLPASRHGGFWQRHARCSRSIHAKFRPDEPFNPASYLQPSSSRSVLELAESAINRTQRQTKSISTTMSVIVHTPKSDADESSSRVPDQDRFPKRTVAGIKKEEQATSPQTLCGREILGPPKETWLSSKVLYCSRPICASEIPVLTHD
jgi:hypothetical protein